MNRATWAARRTHLFARPGTLWLFLAVWVLACSWVLPAMAAPQRVVVLPLFRGVGITVAQASQLQDALTVELISHTDAATVALDRLDTGKKAKLVAALTALGQPMGPASVPVLTGLARATGATRLLVARVDAVRGGGRILLASVGSEDSQVTQAAEARWSGEYQSPPANLQDAVQQWAATRGTGAAVTAAQWPAGAVPADAAEPGDTPAEPAAEVTFEPTPAPPEASAPPTPMGVTAETRTNYYSDNDGNRIVTPTVTASGSIGEHVAIAGHAALDMMTCASVDVISAATSRGYFKENRQEYGGSMTLKREQLGLTLGAVHSRENDYSSATGSIALVDEFAKRNATVSLAYSFTGSNVGRAHDPNFSRRLDSHALTLSYTQVLGKEWVGQLSGFVGVLDGFQSSVYRFVHFANGTAGPEVAPDFRLREAVAVEVRGALAASWFLASTYRIYTDSWGVLSHTGEVAVTWAPLDWLSVRVRDRAYTQRGSTFYKSVYTQPMRYMTIDRELGDMHGNLVGAKIAFDLGSPARTTAWQFDLKYDWMWQHFDDFPWLTDRYMAMVEAGLGCSF